MIEEQTGETPSPEASPAVLAPPAPPPKRGRAYLLYAAGAVGVIVIGLGLWFASSLIFKREVTVTFLDRDGNEIGRRSRAPTGHAGKGSVNYYLDWAFNEAEQLALQASGREFVAVTALNPSMQSKADALIADTLFREGIRFRVTQAALLAMTPDGAVVTMVGGRDYKESAVNRASTTRRPPGSSFSPYVYLLALLGGADPGTVVHNEAPACEKLKLEEYTGGQRQAVSLSRALAWSLNSTPVQLSLEEHYGGREQLLLLLGKLGIEKIKSTCTMALGDQAVTPLSHVSAFAVFANGGRKVQPYAVLELRDASGATVYRRRDDPPPQIVRRASVEQLNRMLREVIKFGTGKAAALDFTPVAGKTGTSNEYKDAWFVGFTGRLVTGVWMGNDDSSPTDRLTGGTLPVQIWKEFNVAAHQGLTIPPIPGLDADPEAEAKQAAPANVGH